MSTELQTLYQEMIIDHGRHPRHFKKLPAATHHLEGYNPLCGDRLTLYLQVKDHKIIDASFEGAGCAISMASASMMTEAVIGLSLEQAKTLFQQFHLLVTTDERDHTDQLGKLIVLGGVKAYPMRVKCATLAWHTLMSALKGESIPVSTE